LSAGVCNLCFQVVTNPIDLLKLQQKLKTDEYEDVEELTSDVQLMVNNAKAFYKVMVIFPFMSVHVCVCVCACVRARACVHACFIWQLSICHIKQCRT
jgi:hypothetical protein